MDHRRHRLPRRRRRRLQHPEQATVRARAKDREQQTTWNLISETTIPWAALGALLAGVGSFLSGWAALKLARRKGEEDAQHEAPVEADAADGDRA